MVRAVSSPLIVASIRARYDLAFNCAPMALVSASVAAALAVPLVAGAALVLAVAALLASLLLRLAGALQAAITTASNKTGRGFEPLITHLLSQINPLR